MRATYMGSRQTREAREMAREAAASELEHRRNCVTCIRAVRQRRDAERCPGGGRLITAKREADAVLAEERRLDKQPIPGQEQLFGDEDFAASGISQGPTP